MHVLEGEELGQDAATVEAAFKRHEAISTDIKARVSVQLYCYSSVTINYCLTISIPQTPEIKIQGKSDLLFESCTLRSGLEKGLVQLIGTSRFSCWASDTSIYSVLAQWTRIQASHSL